MAWTPPGAQDLRDSLLFQRRTPADDGYGNVVGDWETLFAEARRASLRPTRGGETIQAARLAGASLWDAVVRSDSETRQIVTGDRAVDARGLVEGEVVASTRTWNIRWAEDLEGRGRWIVMQLESGVADG